MDLQLLIHISEEKSLTRGAERSHLSLSAASMRMKAFEEVVGTQLLYRTKLGTTLTPAGIIMFRHAKLIFNQLGMMRGDMHEHAQGLKGYIRIFANATSISASLPMVLRQYLTAYPYVDVELRERLSSDGVRAVLDESADIAIVSDDVSTEGLEVFPYCHEALVLATATTHPLSGREKVDFAETLEFPYIGLHEGSALYQFLARQAQIHRSWFSTRIQVGSFEAICRMIEAGVGIGILPESAAQRYARIMSLKLIELADPWSLRASLICVRSFEQLPVFARRLVMMLSDRHSPGDHSGQASESGCSRLERS